IPMLMDSGGNAGSQACVTVIRSIALGELQFKDLFKVIWKELRVSFLVAIVMGIGCFAKLQIIDRLIVGNAGYTVELSLIVSVALMATVIIAKFIGCTLPILAKKIHLDPAVVASPIITTIVDAVSLMIYCSIAIAILS
ncbi:MAG: magnesium transporter, partial [Clostridia bacterium]